LWQLRNTLDATKNEALSDRVLLVDPEWVQIKPEADLGLDVALFEQAFSRTQGVRGRELDSQHVQILQSAVDLYRGGLQESWYQDWYLYEREHFQHMYLIMLDKLMGYCEAHCACETGLTYGALILRCEKAHERTHRRLMRLYCSATVRRPCASTSAVSMLWKTSSGWNRPDARWPSTNKFGRISSNAQLRYRLQRIEGPPKRLARCLKYWDNSSRSNASWLMFSAKSSKISR
jgi:hypothetical protein